jgi:hypothetical protein
MSENHARPLTGGCLCGAARYEAAAPGQPMAAHCYCEDCRKASGTGHCTHVVMPEAGFSLSGAVKGYDRPANSGNIVTRHFCPTCGSALYSTNNAMPGMVFLRASSLDDPNAVTPQALVFTSRAPKWDPLDPALPAFATMPSDAVRESMAEQWRG